MVDKPKAIDLFCGAGGGTEALKDKFEVLAAVEFDDIIAKTYELNHGKNHLIIDDIRNISKQKWLDFVERKHIDLLVGTPPCQGFSRHSRKKASENNDERNLLIFEVLKVSNIFTPEYLFFENVENILNFSVFHEFLLKLSNVNPLGFPVTQNRPSYHIKFESVNSYEYGVPQKRKRLILIAKKISKFPNPNAFVFIENNKPVVKSPLNLWPSKNYAPKLKNYLSQFNLSHLEAGEQDPNDKLHMSRPLSEKNIKRIKLTPPNGGSRNSWTDDLILKCHKKDKVSYRDVYGRMSFYDYAPTMTGGCTSYSKGRFGHPEENRAISFREAALIQTFPHKYKFTGVKSGEIAVGKDKIATQIGNAVPVKLAEAFFDTIYNDIMEKNDKRYDSPLSSSRTRIKDYSDKTLVHS